MHEFKCLINKTYKKISYPFSTVIETIFTNNLPPLSLIINEVKSGDLLVVEFIKNKPVRVFLIENEILHQIYGDPIDFFSKIQLQCLGLKKKIKIEEFIFNLYDQFSLNEMISYKNDFRDFENNLFKYLLLTKNEDKLDNKKLRSLSFKNFKNPHLAEKMSKTLIKNKFNYFDLNETKLTIDFSSLTVQFIDD